MNKVKAYLEHKAYNMRVSSVIMTSLAGSGHPTSALSAADIVAALFFYAMRYDPKTPQNPDNDRFVLSKGHASPILYAAYKELGILTDQDLTTYRSINSVLEGHPTLRFAYTEAATGSLGMGLSIGAGIALSAKVDKRAFKTFVLMGDGEIAEGSIWEAAEIAVHYKLDNLVGIVDCNRLAQSGEVMYDHHLQRYADMFHAFGFKPLTIDGHDMLQIMGALDKAREMQGQPIVILAKTFKGYGISEAQDKNGFHGKSFPKTELNHLIAELEIRFHGAAFYDAQKEGFSWQPKIPATTPEKNTNAVRIIQLPDPCYAHDEKIATRKAFGQALQAVGAASPAAVVLDGDVQNSTYTEIFAKKYPDRFIECYIAEQNMMSMAVGLESRGKLPFVSTFGAFLTRAHDQIRMAAVSTANLRINGSHAGVSIGEDGPSQMALEDIAMMCALPESVVLYPADAVSTYKLVEQMANYCHGISYLRTTRMETPIIYDASEQFPIGGCKVLAQTGKDNVCIIGAGITLHEALKAQQELQIQGISVSVIDVYSIKPLDEKTIKAVAQLSGNKVITVEDHYLQGGLGQAVTYALKNTEIRVECLAVSQLPRSGKPEELLSWAGIDSAAIIKKVKELL
jgi:transketolase